MYVLFLALCSTLMCTALLPPGVNPTAINKIRIISYRIRVGTQQILASFCEQIYNKQLSHCGPVTDLV